MKVSVVVPVYNEENYIVSCLQHILDQEEPADEVIVVDNNCTDRTIDIAKQFPVKIIHQPIQGMIPARNLGFDTATGSLILRTDADTLVPRNWVKHIKDAFEQEDIVAFSGSVLFYSVPEALQVPIKMYSKSFKRIFHHECLFGMNMALRRSTWLTVRDSVCLDDDVVHEDQDLSLHIAKFGRILFDHSLVVVSSPRRWKHLKPYFEYPYRYVKTVKQHQSSIALGRGKLSRRILPKTKKFIDAITYSSHNV